MVWVVFFGVVVGVVVVIFSCVVFDVTLGLFFSWGVWSLFLFFCLVGVFLWGSVVGVFVGVFFVCFLGFLFRFYLMCPLGGLLCGLRVFGFLWGFAYGFFSVPLGGGGAVVVCGGVFIGGVVQVVW